MAKSKSNKRQTLDKLQDKIGQSKSLIFADFKGLKVKDTEQLRRLCDKENVECLVAKKTLIKLALQKTGFDEIDAKQLNGEVAVAFGFNDEVSPAKVLDTFSKDHEALKLLGGVVLTAAAGSRALDSKTVLQFAKLPSKQELLSKLVGTISNPMRGMVCVLQGNIRGLVQVLKAVSEKQ